MARVKISDNTAKVLIDKKLKANTFLTLFMNAVRSTSRPTTPKREGDLRKEVLQQVLGTKGTLIWNRKYARKQEEVQHRNYTTAGTGPHFAKNAVEKVSKEVDKYIKQAQL